MLGTICFRSGNFYHNFLVFVLMLSSLMFDSNEKFIHWVLT